MSDSQQSFTVNQESNGGNHNIQVGQDYQNHVETQKSTNILLIPILVGMTALGGIAWALNAGINHQDSPKVEQVNTPSTPTTATPTELSP